MGASNPSGAEEEQTAKINSQAVEDRFRQEGNITNCCLVSPLIQCKIPCKEPNENPLKGGAKHPCGLRKGVIADGKPVPPKCCEQAKFCP